MVGATADLDWLLNVLKIDEPALQAVAQYDFENGDAIQALLDVVEYSKNHPPANNVHQLVVCLAVELAATIAAQCDFDEDGFQKRITEVYNLYRMIGYRDIV
jgi:hypothetical protein